MTETSRKTVLMLDHEPLLIDRRIVLEAQSLVKDGWNVVLATRGDGTKPSRTTERGMQIERFMNFQEEFDQSNSKENARLVAGNRALRISLDRQRIQGWIQTPENSSLRQFFDRFRLPVALKKLLYWISWPPAVAGGVRSRAPRLKQRLGHFLEPIIYAAMLRPSFLTPYLRFALDRILHPASQPLDGELLLTNGSWQKKIYDFSLNLKPDIVHAHDLPNLALGHKIAKELGAILVYDAHELYPLQYFSDEARRASLLKAERELIAYADAVITVNSQCVEVLQKEYQIENIIPLTNATESPVNFDPMKRQRLWHERFNLPQNVQIMVFQGGINPVRNVDTLVESIVDIPDHIHIGFITYAKDIPYYDEMTKRLGVYHRVHYVVEIPWDEVNQWLASANVGIMPYQVTNFNAKISSPNKLYEFVVAGLPIIASSELDNVKAAIETDGIGIMTLLRGVDSYQKVIREMFDHPEGPDRFRGNVLSVRHKYMWSNEEPKLLNLYRSFRSIGFAPKALRKNETQVLETRGAACAE